MGRGEHLFKTLWPDYELEVWQRPVLEEIVEFLEDPEPNNAMFMCILGSNGTGKTAFLAWVCILALLLMHAKKIRFKGSIYSGKFDQLKTTLMRETLDWALLSTASELFNCQTESLSIKGTQSFLNAKAWSLQDPQKVAGQHSDFSMAVMDEGSAIPTPIMDKVNGSMTDKKNLWLITSNSNSDHGFIYDLFTKEDPAPWLTRKVTYSDLTFRQNKGWEERTRMMHGVDSEVYRTQVLADFPKYSTVALIPRIYIEGALSRKAIKSYIFCLNMACDIASGEGADYSAIVIRRGGEILFCERRKLLYSEMYAWICEVCDKWGIRSFAIDENGVGSGLYQKLRDDGFNVIPVHSKTILKDRVRFYDKRAELFSMMRDWVVNVAALTKEGDNSILVQELSEIQHSHKDGRLFLRPKRELKKSRDLADALAYTFMGPEDTLQKNVYRKMHEFDNRRQWTTGRGRTKVLRR